MYGIQHIAAEMSRKMDMIIARKLHASGCWRIWRCVADAGRTYGALQTAAIGNSRIPNATMELSAQTVSIVHLDSAASVATWLRLNTPPGSQ